MTFSSPTKLLHPWDNAWTNCDRRLLREGFILPRMKTRARWPTNCFMIEILDQTSNHALYFYLSYISLVLILATLGFRIYAAGSIILGKEAFVALNCMV
jgi:hypothetical protein